jgi:oligopeptide transport system substrate-binding protein
MATAWEVSGDGLTWTFHLRPNARWSNGEAVTARDFVFGFRRAVSPVTASSVAGLLAPIANARGVMTGRLPPEALGVEAPDSSTLRIRLEAAVPWLPQLLTHPVAYPLHRPSLAAHGDAFTRPGNLVSNGAFHLSEWLPQSHVKLVRNHHYWNRRNVAIDEVWFLPLDNQAAELARYRDGELDWSYDVPHQQFGWIRRNLSDELHVAPRLAVSYLGFNLTRPPFGGVPGLRRALAMAVDRELIVRAVTGSGEIPAYALVPAMDGYDPQRPEWADWSRDRQIEEARELYARAGYGPRRPLKLELLYTAGPNNQRLAVAIASMWREYLGVQTSLTGQEFKVFLETRQDLSATEAFRSNWVADFRDVMSFLGLFDSAAGSSDTGFQSEAYDALLEASMKTGDRDRRQELLEQAERLLLEHQPVAPLYFYVTKRLVKPWVRGWAPNPMDIHPSQHFYLVARQRR